MWPGKTLIFFDEITEFPEIATSLKFTPSGFTHRFYSFFVAILCAMYGFETKQAILDNSLRGNAKGGIYENIISESLIKRGYRLYYYKPDDSHELEFLLEKGGEVVPVEVKAGNNPTVSLNSFIKKYGPSVAFKFINGNVGETDGKLTLPHYMVMFM